MVSLSDVNCVGVPPETGCPAVEGDDDLKKLFFWTSDCWDDTCRNDSTGISGAAYFLDHGGVIVDNRYDYYAGVLCK